MSLEQQNDSKTPSKLDMEERDEYERKIAEFERLLKDKDEELSVKEAEIQENSSLAIKYHELIQQVTIIIDCELE